MERFFLLLTFALFGYLSFHATKMEAQGTGVFIQDTGEQPVSVIPAQGILWEISGKNLSSPSYLYAVLHVVPREQFFLHTALDSIMRLSDLVLMEVDPETEKKDYLFRSEVPIDSTLDVILSRRDFKVLESFIDNKLTTDSRQKLIQRYPPLILMRQMMLDYCLYRKHDKQAASYEEYLRMATKEKAFQSLQMDWVRLAWLDSHSLQEQSRILLEAIEDRENQRLAYEGMLRAYRQGNLDRVWLLSMDSPDLGDNKHTLIDLKISNWKKALMQKMPQSRVCAVIPATILPGEYGLLHVLRKAGYTVKPISMK